MFSPCVFLLDVQLICAAVALNLSAATTHDFTVAHQSDPRLPPEVLSHIDI